MAETSGPSEIDETGAAPSEPQTTANATGMPTQTTGRSDDTGGGEASNIKLDVGAQSGDADTGRPGADGCERIDFLFVIDNSISMADEQQSLVASFPGFIDAIQNTLMAQDYHIAVVDTDAESTSFSSMSCNSGDCSCEPGPQCCFAVCANSGPIVFQPAPTQCLGTPCDSLVAPSGCDIVLGAGKNADPLGQSCGVQGNGRFLTDAEPDLVDTFECVALVGAGGDGNERPMDALAAALTSETISGGCHEGFLRDDAILVITFITDEDDVGSNAGPPEWVQRVVSAKASREQSVVVLGLLNDAGVPGGACGMDMLDTDSARLRTFTDSFSRGQWASVCAAGYDGFFEAAVSVVDTACDDFNPPG